MKLLLAFFAASLSCLPFEEVSAQATMPFAGVSFSARSTGETVTAPATTISLVYAVSSHSPDSALVHPSIFVPKGWDVTIGAQPFILGPGETDSWVIGVSVPAAAAAGRYAVGVSARTGDAKALLDSAIVVVTERHAISLALVDRPLYVVAGSSYEIGYRVRNTGNVTETVHLLPENARHSLAKLDAAVLTIPAGESRTVHVTVTTRTKAGNDGDDVFALHAITEGVASLADTASSRVVVVGKPGDMAPMVTVPAVLRVRVSPSAGSVSPYELVGGGPIGESGHGEIEFAFRGRTARNSILGERAENRVEIRGSHYRARIGDNYYMLSPLTGGGQSGFGGGLELTGSLLTAGAYSQNFRYLPGKQSERGGFLRLDRSGQLFGSRLSLNAVERKGGSLAGRIVSSALSLHPFGSMLLDIELASSQSAIGRGSARMFRLTGDALKRMHYDLGQMAGDARFQGPSRDAENDYATLSVRATSNLLLNGAVNVGALNFSRASSGADSIQSTQRYTTATLGGIYAGVLSLEYSEIGRQAAGGATPENRVQRLVRTRFEHSTGLGNFWLSGEAGQRSDSSRIYHQVGIGAAASRGRAAVSLYLDLYDGGSLTRGPTGNTLLGASGSFALSRANVFTFNGFKSSYHSLAAGGYSQLDSRLVHSLDNGSSVSLRYRISSATSAGLPSNKLFFVEYGLPLSVPVRRVHLPGSVAGRVIDAESNRPIAGALVRVGSKAAITDRTGKVSFTGLNPGDYRVSLASEVTLANAAVTGNPLVRIDSLRDDAPSFTLAVMRSSRVKGVVRSFAVARTAFADTRDSLVESKPLEGVTIALMGQRDTLYRTTETDGKFMFDELPTGEWTMRIADDAPVAFRYERESIQVVTRPGQESRVEFRLLPRRKSVQIIASGDASSTVSSPQEQAHK